MQQDVLAACGTDEAPFKGWTGKSPEVEKARAMIAAWDRTCSAGLGTRGYLRALDDHRRRAQGRRRQDAGRTAGARRIGLSQALARLTKDWGADWSQWRYGRINESKLPHMFVEASPAVERPGGFNSVNATGANFRRVIDLSRSRRDDGDQCTGQSAQPGSPYYGNLRGIRRNGIHFPLPFSRAAVDKQAAHADDRAEVTWIFDGHRRARATPRPDAGVRS